MNDVNRYFESANPWHEELSLLRSILLSIGLKETLKWGAPVYVSGTDNVVGLASFKNYTALWFFQGGLLEDKEKRLMNAQEGKTKAMRQWRFYNKEEIIQAPITEYVLESIDNFNRGLKIKVQSNTSEIVIPHDLDVLMVENSELNTAWNALTVAVKREYVEYISEAKRDVTKQARLEKIVPMILKGISLNAKYKK